MQDPYSYASHGYVQTKPLSTYIIEMMTVKEGDISSPISLFEGEQYIYKVEMRGVEDE